MTTYIIANTIVFALACIASFILLPSPVVRIGLSAKWNEYKNRTLLQHAFHIVIATLLITLVGIVMGLFIVRAIVILRRLQFPEETE